MKKWMMGLFFVFFLSGCLLFQVRADESEVPEELENLYARSAVLLDADSGRVLFGKEETAVLPMASTTKIMTCILVLENTQTDEIAGVSRNAASQPKVRLGVQEGEHYQVANLL